MNQEPGFYIALACMLAFIGWIARWILRKIRAHREALMKIAQAKSFKYHRHGEGVIPTSHPVFSWFRKGYSYDLNHVVEGRTQEFEFQFFELAQKKDEEASTYSTVFAIKRDGAEWGEFSVEPDYKDHAADESFADVFTCKSGVSDFTHHANDELKKEWVQIRAQNSMKSKWFRTSPYFIRCSGDLLVCDWPLLPFEKDEAWFHECMNETLAYARSLN